MAVVVKIADDGDLHAEPLQPVDDRGDSARGLVGVDGDADQLAPGLGQLRDLPDGRLDVGRVGVGHGLHHDRVARPDRNAANPDRRSVAPDPRWSRCSLPVCPSVRLDQAQ